VLNELRRQPIRNNDAPDAVDEHAAEQNTRECLGRCIDALDGDSRELILGYYTGEQRVKIDARRALAQKHHISVNALSIRACRIRGRLGSCIRRCMSER